MFILGSFWGYGVYVCWLCVVFVVEFVRISFGSVWVFVKVCILLVGRVYIWVCVSCVGACLLVTFFCNSFGGF